MLNSVRQCISFYSSNDVSFAERYDSYVCGIQDMDIDNEILPVIRQQSTEYIKELNRHRREIDKIRKNYCNVKQS